MAKSKAPAAPKKGGGSKFDFQKFLLEKGEKVGLIAAGAAFALLALFGIMQAMGAANPNKLAGDLKSGAASIDDRLVNSPDTPPEPKLPPDPRYVRVKTTDYVTNTELFNTAATISEKRANPKALACIAGEARFVIGAIEAHDIIDNMIATIVGRTKAQNNAREIDKLRRHQKLAAKGGAGQPPTPPPSNVAPPPIAGGGFPGAGMGKGGGKMAPGGGQQNRVADSEIGYVPIDSKSVETAELAKNIIPKRLALVRGLVPYKMQVGEYLKALRFDADDALAADNCAPTYRGYVVERQTLTADGKTIVHDWSTFEPVEAAREIYRLAADLEPEDEKYIQFIPEVVHKLYLPRPKMARGEYPLPQMPALGQALQEIEKSGAKTKDLTDKQKKLQGKDDLFDLRGGQGAPTTGPGNPPIVPPPVANPRGSGRGGRGEVMRGGPGGGLMPIVRTNDASPVWLLQFIDPTIEAAKCYKYRVKLKLLNPNYRRPEVVANPGQAEAQELESEWFEIPDIVSAPPEEYIYAGGDKAKDSANIGTSNYDTTKLVYHRWYDGVRVTKNALRADPVGDWVCAELEVKRGQYVHQERPFRLPIWSMVNGGYLFRNYISPPTGNKPITAILRGENVRMDFTPETPVILVDFCGGRGSYKLPNGFSISDDSASEVLLMSDDGKSLRLTARSSIIDGNKDEPIGRERFAREDAWRKWLDDVYLATERNLGAPGTGPGGPGIP